MTQKSRQRRVRPEPRSSTELIAGNFRRPDPEWLDDNYFHSPSDDDWVTQIEQLVAARAEAPLPLKKLRYGRAGGRLRQVWDRKRALGSRDRSPVGYAALVIGHPARVLERIARRGIELSRTVRRGVAKTPIE